jgi:hypothetical protein
MASMPREEVVMASPKLDIAFWNYDRTRLLADAAVKIDGAHFSCRYTPEIVACVPL